MSNYTKGNWIVNELSLNESAFEILTSRPMENGMNGSIAHIKCENYTVKGQAELNARLISAAPDLLEAIKYYFDVLNEARGKDWKDKPDHVLAKMIDAVDKATQP